jgi:hypothetical protein
MFGTYIEPGRLIVYGFFEYYYDMNAEYKPSELGRTQEVDYRGEFRASEELLFLAYGVTDRLAIELEGAVTQAELKTSPADNSGLPPKISESGIGDVEGQLRWRWLSESAEHPMVFSYFETVGPTQDEGKLIGTSDWEFKFGTGVTRGFSWGTVTARGAVEYTRAGSEVAMGELALEYLRRLSHRWRVFGTIEGTQDEVSAIAEAQLHFSRHACIKANSGFGVTSKSAGWTPEMGVLLLF